jgi:hypothetical protein
MRPDEPSHFYTAAQDHDLIAAFDLVKQTAKVLTSVPDADLVYGHGNSCVRLECTRVSAASASQKPATPGRGFSITHGRSLKADR